MWFHIGPQCVGSVFYPKQDWCTCCVMLYSETSLDSKEVSSRPNAINAAKAVGSGSPIAFVHKAQS
eukprot:1424647-Amphidinium_carterae.1